LTEKDDNDQDVRRIELKKVLSYDQLASRQGSQLKIELLTIDNYRSNPDAVAQLAGLTVKKVKALAEAE